MVMGFNNAESIAHELVSADFSGTGLFDPVEVCKSLTLADVNERLHGILCDDCTVLSVVNPIG